MAHTNRSVDSHSRQKYRSRLASELSVIVTCSRAPFLDPVLVKPRSSTTVSPKCTQSQNLSPNTSPPRSIQWKPIRRPCNHARSAIPRTTAGGIGGARRGISCRRQVFHFFQAPGMRPRNWGRNDARHPMCIQPEQDNLQPPTALPRTLKVPHPRAKLYMARVCQTTASCLCPSLHFGSWHLDGASAGLASDAT